MSLGQDNNEKELISRLIKGEIKAFDDLYWKYQKAVYQNALKLTHDTMVAEDIVQEVFISFWEKREYIDADRSVGGWLFVTSYNRSVNALKKKLKESLAYKQLGFVETETDTGHDVSTLQLAILEKAVEKLSPQKRKVFELCKLQGKTYEEAAKALKISKHTVKEYLTEAVSFVKDFASKHPESGIGMVSLFFVNSL